VCKIKNKKQQEKSSDTNDTIKKFGRVLIKALGIVVFAAAIFLIISSWRYAFTYDEPLIVLSIVATIMLGGVAVFGLLPFIMPRIRERKARAIKEKQ